MPSKHAHSRSKTFTRWFMPVPQIENGEPEARDGLLPVIQHDGSKEDGKPAPRTCFCNWLTVLALLIFAFSFMPSSSSACGLAISSYNLHFGSVTTGKSSTLDEVFTNPCKTSITITKETLSGSSEFTMEPGTLPITIGSWKSTSLNITFKPTTAGQVTASVSVLSNAASPTKGYIYGTGEGQGQHYVTLKWNASTSSSVSYNIYRGADSGGPYTRIASSVSGTTYTDSNVSAYDTYYYVTRAVNSSGVESSYSNQASASIPAQ
jgi:hypothetical protein